MLVYRIGNWAATLAFLAVIACGADWLSERGDSRGSAWQRRETAITPATVPGLQVIWKLSLAGQTFSSPIILGHLITHRGTLELVFVLSSGGELLAVDGDLGKVFWSRRLQAFSARPPTPVLTPPSPQFKEEEDDDAPQPLRPLYVLAGDGRLHSIHPALGSDLRVWQFVSPGVHVRGLNLDGNEVIAPSVDGEWHIDISRADSKPVFHSKMEAARERTAAWEDSARVKWRCVWRGDRLEAFAASASTPAWTWHGAGAMAAPVVGGGLVFALSGGVLTALDAATGRPLYRSARIASGPTSEMALANGHLCFVSGFVTGPGILWCFGFPVDL